MLIYNCTRREGDSDRVKAVKETTSARNWRHTN